MFLSALVLRVTALQLRTASDQSTESQWEQLALDTRTHTHAQNHAHVMHVRHVRM